LDLNNFLTAGHVKKVDIIYTIRTKDMESSVGS